MKRWMMLCIAACWLNGVSAPVLAASVDTRACVECHPSARKILRSAMALRAGERAFARRVFGEEAGDRFFSESCSGCHVSSCSDCHGKGEHPMRRPANDDCLHCHRGYSAGWEYEGKAPREDHSRFQRGATSQGMPYLKMLPDVHFEAGMTCADCHPMASLHIGGRAKQCVDCHPQPSPDVPEHAIEKHMTGMRCVACHAAWAAQEYGTFLIRASSDRQREAFAPLPQWGTWKKSAHLKRQDAPPLGVDAKGLVSPIRPRFILFVTDGTRGWENHLAAAEWRVVSPHTIRRGSVSCGGCHDNDRRFLLESPGQRLYRLKNDGLALESYWDRSRQSVINGSFVPRERYAQANVKSPEHARQVVNQWQNILNRVAPPSRR